MWNWMLTREAAGISANVQDKRVRDAPKGGLRRKYWQTDKREKNGQTNRRKYTNLKATFLWGSISLASFN